MNNPILKSTLILLFAAGLGFSQSTQSLSPNKASQTPAIIYSEILQSLPQSIKAKVDSAVSIRTREPKNAVSKQSAITESAQKSGLNSKTAAIDQLPVELREKVEKAILIIDKQRDKRKMEFKDNMKP